MCSRLPELRRQKREKYRKSIRVFRVKFLANRRQFKFFRDIVKPRYICFRHVDKIDRQRSAFPLRDLLEIEAPRRILVGFLVIVFAGRGQISPGVYQNLPFPPHGYVQSDAIFLCFLLSIVSNQVLQK